MDDDISRAMSAGDDSQESPMNVLPIASNSANPARGDRHFWSGSDAATPAKAPDCAGLESDLSVRGAQSRSAIATGTTRPSPPSSVIRSKDRNSLMMIWS